MSWKDEGFLLAEKCLKYLALGGRQLGLPKTVSSETGSYISLGVGLEGVSGKFALEIRRHRVHGRIKFGSKAFREGPQLEGTS